MSCTILLVYAEEFDEAHALFGAAALLRSTYEDVLQIRCNNAAGRSAAKLDPRAEDPKVSLFPAKKKKKLASSGSKWKVGRENRGNGGTNNSGNNSHVGSGNSQGGYSNIRASKSGGEKEGKGNRTSSRGRLHSRQK